MQPQQKLVSPAGTRVLAFRALQFVSPHRVRVAVIVALSLLLSALSAADPMALKWLFDAVGAADQRALFAALGALLGIEVARAGISAATSAMSWQVRLGLDLSLRESIVQKLTSASVDYHSEQGVGGTMTKVNQSTAAFVSAFCDVAFNVVPSIVYLALSLVAMWRMEWRLAFVVLVFAPVPALVGAWATPQQTAREHWLMQHWTHVYSRLNEVLAGIRTVKLFSMERMESARFLDGQREGNTVVLRGARLDSVNAAWRGLAAALARLAAIGVGGYFVLRGQITVGVLVAFLGYVGGVFGPVQGLTSTYQTLRKGSVALATIYDILDTEQEVEDLPGAEEVEGLRGDLWFRDVNFAFRNAPPLLTGFNLRVRPGETVALVGPSGSGKSTLMNLLLRLHPIQSGSICVDERDIRSFTAESLRRHVSIVAQDVHLFNDTVRANIAYARPEASEEDVIAAARNADAHEFIMGLPDGYDTVIGDRGGRLSGGQRQRLGIARALLKDAPVLVLDEATSALDALSESVVQDALAHLRSGRTTIVIAHRLSTVVDADRIVLLKDGQVYAEGTHDELVAQNDYYASLVHASTDGMLQVA